MLSRTPLFSLHEALKAKIVPFAGWEMPVWYEGLISEHLHVRKSVGLFDVSHMGEIFVEGSGAAELLQYLTCNDITKLYDGRAQYSALLNDNGGVVDDIIVYRLAVERFLVCVNASNTDKAFQWMERRAKDMPGIAAKLSNRSNDYGQIAIQGPESVKLIDALFQSDNLASKILALKNYHQLEATLLGKSAIIARTGYTGEDGFEIFIEADSTPELWNYLLSYKNAKPIGLAARDSLRVEAGYPLYGHELGDDIFALEGGLGWIIKGEKGDFIGRNAIRSKTQQSQLVGLEISDGRIGRENTKVLDKAGNGVGAVTSGTLSPLTKKSIAMARVDNRAAQFGTELQIDVRGTAHKAIVVDKNFYKRKV